MWVQWGPKTAQRGSRGKRRKKENNACAKKGTTSACSCTSTSRIDVGFYAVHGDTHDGEEYGQKTQLMVNKHDLSFLQISIRPNSLDYVHQRMAQASCSSEMGRQRLSNRGPRSVLPVESRRKCLLLYYKKTRTHEKTSMWRESQVQKHTYSYAPPVQYFTARA